MKKLSKINISAEKVLGNEELVNLKGGYEWSSTCICMNTITNGIYGYLLCESLDCDGCCKALYGPDSTGYIARM